MKKVLATVLALVMALGLCTTSWAANTDLPQADANGVITLTDDVVLAAGKEINKAGMTQVTKIDLGGHKLSRAGGFVLDIYGDVTITNGTIEMTGAESGSAIWINNGAKVTIDNSVKAVRTSEFSAFSALGRLMVATAMRPFFSSRMLVISSSSLWFLSVGAAPGNGTGPAGGHTPPHTYHIIVAR